MYETLLNKYAINQIGYVVDDIEQAALLHSRLFGSGPFITIPTQAYDEVTYRGGKTPLSMDLAYGAYGNLQIELIKPLGDGPSVYREKKGFNHFSIWSDDPDQVVADFAAAGFEVAMTMVSGAGLVVRYIDCLDAWGHFVEVHTPQPYLNDINKKMAAEWDGSEPLRPMGR